VSGEFFMATYFVAARGYVAFMNTSSYRKNVLESILRIWLCPLFSGRTGFKRFSGNGGFYDDDVAYALGMDDWGAGLLRKTIPT
jgi:hypothetical protein